MQSREESQGLDLPARASAPLGEHRALNWVHWYAKKTSLALRGGSTGIALLACSSSDGGIFVSRGLCVGQGSGEACKNEDVDESHCF